MTGEIVGNTGSDISGEDMIERALCVADLNVVRVILFQVTGDELFAHMRTVKKPIRGGTRFVEALAPEHHADVRQAAGDLLRAGRLTTGPRPSDEQAIHLMELLVNERIPDEGIAYALEELSLDEFPRDVTWSSTGHRERLRDFRVAIVGAGIGGIAMAIVLSRLGIANRVYERRPEIGGTWSLNHYPEARVDVTSYLYQYRFEKNYPWTEYFATGPETQRYLRFITEKYGVSDNIVLNAEVESARWDDSAAKWQLQICRDGSTQTEDYDVVVSASGLFSAPKLPDIPGIENFAGQMFHTTAWDHSVPVAGQRVGLIGNGSTGTQIMGYLAEQAETLVAFQRTPQWVTPMERYKDKVEPEVQWLFENVPYYWNFYVFLQHYATTHFEPMQVIDPQWQRTGGYINERNDALRVVATDYVKSKLAAKPELIDKCLPSYAPLGRRLVVDNGWYDALLRDNVELVTESISQINVDGVTTVDGVHRTLDVIVLATGFRVDRYFAPIDYEGRDGITTSKLWANDGPRAYLGITMPGFPNLFSFYGPNGQPRNGSYHSWAESWARYVGQCIVALIENDKQSIEVRQEVFDEYNADLDTAMHSLLWESEGVGGYLVNDHGRPGVAMPWPSNTYYRWLKHPDLSTYTFR